MCQNPQIITTNSSHGVTVCFVNLELKNVLAHAKAKRHPEETEVPEGCVEGCQVGGFFVKSDVPVSIASIELTEKFGS